MSAKQLRRVLAQQHCVGFSIEKMPTIFKEIIVNGWINNDKDILRSVSSNGCS